MNIKSFIIFSVVFLISMFFVSAFNTNDLLAYYDFDNTNVSKAIDSTGRYNATTLITTDVTSMNGIKGKAYNFSGTATATYNATFTKALSTYNAVSINFWLNHVGTTNTQKFVSFSNNSIRSGLFMTTIQSSPNNFIYRNQNPDNSYNNYILGTTKTGWHMYSLTLDQSNNILRLYIDGVQDYANLTFSDLPVNTSVLSIGAMPFDVIDELSVFNTTL
jgi:hypothetical protein